MAGDTEYFISRESLVSELLARFFYFSLCSLRYDDVLLNGKLSL